jgi:hypothetical protein
MGTTLHRLTDYNLCFSFHAYFYAICGKRGRVSLFSGHLQASERHQYYWLKLLPFVLCVLLCYMWQTRKGQPISGHLQAWDMHQYYWLVTTILAFPSIRIVMLWSRRGRVSRLAAVSKQVKGSNTSGGQTPWPNGRPADIDSISDQWSKVRNIAIFSQKIRKDLNLNIDQSLDIWSKPSKDRNFLRKKIKGFKFRSWTFKTP